MDARSTVFTINRKVDADKLVTLTNLTTPSYVDHTIECCTAYSPGRHLVKVGIATYRPEDKKHWPGEPPRIVLTFNHRISFLLHARLDWNNQRLPVADEEIHLLFNEWLFKHGVYEERWWDDAKQEERQRLGEVEETSIAIDVCCRRQQSLDDVAEERTKKAQAAIAARRRSTQISLISAKVAPI